MSAVLSFEAVTIRHGRRLAVQDASFSVERGSVYALLGRNGAGKSSLVRCALGLARPTSGRVRLLDGDPWRTRREAMARVGVVPEEPDAPPEMTAHALARFCAPLYPRWDAAGYTERITRLGAPMDVPFERLSKGQKGIVMLALALAPSPEVLVLDDPTLGLDVVARSALFGELIGELADRGTTVFVTTHDLSAIEGLADRVGILSGTRLVIDEPIESLKAARGGSLEQIFTAVTTEAVSA
jgi:ABC-type multidrug transport system ATPase subunit